MPAGIESLEELPQSLANAVIKEINQVRDESLVKATIEQAESAKELGEQRSMEDVGRMRFNIHPTIYHYFGDRYGYECWNDDEFRRDFEKGFPTARVKCGGTKVQVGYTGINKPKFKKVYSEED
jgi:hypothetical protein